MAKLAINGGKRVIPEDMPMFHTWPMVDEEDKQAILAVFDRGKYGERMRQKPLRFKKNGQNM